MAKWTLNYWFIATSLFLIYGLLWPLGWTISAYFETLTGIASWFLPAGIRVTFLLFCDKKYLWVIILAEICGAHLVTIDNIPFASFISRAVGTAAAISVQAFCIHLYLKSSSRVRFDSVHHVIKLFLWTGFAALITAVFLVTNMLFLGHIEESDLLTSIALFMLGDYIGILFLVPIVFALKSIYSNKNTIDIRQIPSTFNISLMVLTVITSIFLIKHDMLYFLKVFAFVPIVLSAYKNGWLGATLTLFIVYIIIFSASLYSSDTTSMLESQLYLITISITGLLLGAATSEQKSLSFLLTNKNNELHLTNSKLLTLLEKNQLLSQKVVNIQEDERKTISRQLHDELGQNITALKLKVQVIKEITVKSKITPILESIDNIANVMYQSTSNLMHWLRPRVLDDLGLQKALTGPTFEQFLNNANIMYIPKIEGDLSFLNGDITIAVYRIAQESINNTVKHSRAEHCWLSLKVDDSHTTLTIKDDGIGFDVQIINEIKNNFGLQGIEDRVIALGGNNRLTTDSNGTCHIITFKN